MASDPVSNAGIAQTPDGQRVIPASLRPDGTTRKEIRVRPGYRPPEDIEIYKNRTAEAWKNRGSGGVPGAASVSDDDGVKKAGDNKNAKRRAARKKAKEKEVEVEEGEKVAGEKEEKKADGKKEEKKADGKKEEKKADGKKEALSEEDKEKFAKGIRKKIRQANELKERKEGGENLLPEQLEKVIKLSELVRQLNALGFEQ
ncbi:hypothetical protein RUND412_009361 [Rhizina undulata]